MLLYYQKLKLFIKSHTQLLKDHAVRVAGRSGVNIVQPSVTRSDEGSSFNPEETSDFGGDGSETSGGQICYVEGDGSAEDLVEINTFMAKSGGNKRFVPRGGMRPFRGGARGDRRQPAPRFAPPKESSAPRCINCNSQDHKTSDCPNPRVDKSKRKCFICQGVGHEARFCPERPKQAPRGPVKMINESEAEAAPRVFVVEGEGWERRGQPRPMPKPFLARAAARGPLSTATLTWLPLVWP